MSLNELDALRKNALTALLVSFGFLLAGGALWVTLPTPFIGLCLVIVAVLLLIFWYGKKQKTFSYQYKQTFVKATLEKLFDDVQFDPNDGFSAAMLHETGMVYTGDRFSSNDLVTASYKGVPFTQCDVHIEDESTDSDGNTTYSTIFQGRWMIYRFNKTFKADLQVCSKHFAAAKKSGLFTAKDEKRNAVKMENEAFNKKFRVYAQNEHEAFYLLTPHFMDAVLKLRETTKAQLMLLFIDGDLHVAVDNRKDAFEPSLFRSVNSDKETEKALADIKVITDFVDELRLDNQLFKA